MNTSFNLSHEPIVNSPRDAIATFFSSGMDVLYLGDYKIQKQCPKHLSNNCKEIQIVV